MAKVLIIEDDQFLSKMYLKKLGLAGFQVDCAYDGEEGLAKMKSVKPDFVIMDIMMPKLNGLDAISRAKADEEIKNIPILVLTNLANADDSSLAIEKGAAGYLIKSDFTPGEIVEKIKELLKGLPSK